MSNRAQRIAERIDVRLGDNGRKWKNEFVAMVVLGHDPGVDFRSVNLWERQCFCSWLLEGHISPISPAQKLLLNRARR